MYVVHDIQASTLLSGPRVITLLYRNGRKSKKSIGTTGAKRAIVGNS